jgi:hypothetical protein
MFSNQVFCRNRNPLRALNCEMGFSLDAGKHIRRVDQEHNKHNPGFVSGNRNTDTPIQVCRAGDYNLLVRNALLGSE